MADEAARYGWSDAWQDLLMLHAPFRASEDEDFQDLLRQLSAIEQLFLENPSLQAYYSECMGVNNTGPKPSLSGETVHICAMQLQLMEDAYFSLRLDQCANAPDNRGWMNLFRRWGRSSFFQIQFLALQSTFSIQFVEFYQNYVENWDPIDEAPIPHPWDLTDGAEPHYGSAGRTRKAVETMETTRARFRQDRIVPGIYLDSGRRETGTGSGHPPGDRREPLSRRTGEHGTDTGSGDSVTESAVLLPGIRTTWLGAGGCALAVAATIAVIALGGYNRLPGRDAAVPLPMKSLGSRPVLQLELARGDADVAAILATRDDAARTRLVQNLRNGTWLDSLYLIPAYTLLLAALALLIQRGGKITSRKIFITTLWAIAAIALCDALENWGIAHVASLLDHNEPLTGVAWRIASPALVKWILLAVVLTVLGALALMHSGWRLVAGALLSVAGPMTAVQLVRYFAERFGYS